MILKKNGSTKTQFGILEDSRHHCQRKVGDLAPLLGGIQLNHVCLLRFGWTYCKCRDLKHYRIIYVYWGLEGLLQVEGLKMSSSTLLRNYPLEGCTPPPGWVQKSRPAVFNLMRTPEVPRGPLAYLWCPITAIVVAIVMLIAVAIVIAIVKAIAIAMVVAVIAMVKAIVVLHPSSWGRPTQVEYPPGVFREIALHTCIPLSLYISIHTRRSPHMYSITQS